LNLSLKPSAAITIVSSFGGRHAGSALHLISRHSKGPEWRVFFLLFHYGYLINFRARRETRKHIVVLPDVSLQQPVTITSFINVRLTSARTSHPLKRINRGASFIRNSITSTGVLPRPSAAKSQVRQIRASPAMTRCRFALVPLDCA
jgi:hypothetical protein